MLLRLIETGTVRGAADELALTQSAVTKALKELETLLGVPLFERDARGMHPTLYCAPLEQFARETLLGLDAAVTAIRDLLRGSAGRVCIGVSPGRAETLVMEQLPRIRATFPGVVPYLHSDDSRELMRELEAGLLDFALLSPPPVVCGSSFSFLPLVQDPLHTLARPGHRSASALLVPAAELLDCEWVLPPRHDPVREQVGFALLASGSDEPRRLIEANSLGVALDLASRHDLITVAPATLARDALARHRLVALSTPYHLAPLSIGVMRYRRRELRAGAHGMLALLLRLLRHARREEAALRATA